MKKFMVAPSILSADFADMGRAAENIAQWGADVVHCDVMDGMYVPNITFGMPMIKALRKRTDLILDAHLMIYSPDRYVKAFCEAGADIVTIHPDAFDDANLIIYTLDLIKNAGKKAGLAINANVPFSVAGPFMDNIDLLLIMTVQAGFGGQRFREDCFSKILLADQARRENGYDFLLEVDGGVDLSNVSRLKQAGVDIAVAGNSIFKASDPKDVIRQFHNA